MSTCCLRIALEPRLGRLSVTVEDLQIRFQYNRWANRRLVQAASSLPPESYTKDLNASFGSVRGTFVHILWVEIYWLRCWQNAAEPPRYSPDALPNATELAVRWAELEQEQEAFINHVSDEQLRTSRTARGYAYPLGELIHHCLNHSTYHRGQAALLLRQLGQNPPATDFRLVLTELRYGATY